jgi:dolichyl-phosphate beta-glucosyltransferase
MSEPPHLSIVVPAFDEARRLPPTLVELEKYAREFSRQIEVLLVVETSTDRSFEIAREFAAAHRQFIAIDSGVQRGKGHAVRTGVLRAQGDFIFYMDADLSVPLPEIGAFLECFALHPEIDVLLGNRQHARSEIVRRQSPLREGLGKAFNRILQRLGIASLHDTQCGFKAFRRHAAHAIFSRQSLDGFAFDVEVLLLAERLGFRTADLPVKWINSPDSRVRIVRDSLAMLRDSLRVRRIVDRTLRDGAR